MNRADNLVVTLTPEELLTAALIGARRQVSAMVRKRQSSDNAYEPFDIHILGCMGELAAAKTFNLFWPDAVGPVDGHDVGGLIEVRCRRGGGALGIKQAHKPHMPYLLLHANAPEFVFAGWIYGGDGWEIGTPANNIPALRFVDPSQLRPVRELFELVEALRLERR